MDFIFSKKHKERKNRFEGWYYKHQKDDDIIAFIPGQAGSGAFVQMIDSEGSRQFDVAGINIEGGVVHAGNCRFSCKGALIDLPDVKGQIEYGPIRPLGRDIMGPFRFLPMECRHGVISMYHELSGKLVVDGTERCFDGGTGYIEKDSGTSFPRSYLWLQCNDFPDSLSSVMVSIAHIPFAVGSFTGCICAIVFKDREYRLATYAGVRIHAASPEHICLSQGKLLLEIDICSADKGHPLSSPVRGQMSGVIHESNKASIHLRLWEKGNKVMDVGSCNGSLESVGW